MSRDYLSEAKAAFEIEEAARIETAIAARANAMREADERQQRHSDLCAKHGLPETSTPRQVADAVIDYGNRWRSFVACRFAGSATAAEILSLESITDDRRRSEVQARRDRLWAQFEADYARDIAARPAASGPMTDSAVQAIAHNTGIAA